MSRVWVSNNAGTVMAEIRQDDVDGYVSASCGLGDWATVPDRHDRLHDVVEEAGIHLDHHH